MAVNENRLFTPTGGGLGASLACTGTSSRVALPSPTVGSVFCVNNLGLDNVFLAFGNASIVATTSYMAFAPGVSYIGIPNAGGSGAPTYLAGITGGSSITVQVTPGNMASGS